MKTVKFAQVLKFSENLVKVDKPEEERYVTVLLYGRGVIEREIKEGKVPVAFTGYKAHAGQLIISTINARNGAAGIIPAELEGAVVSKDFPLFDIDHECVDEQYLLYYLWSDSFIHKAEQNSFGATMPRLHVKPFLNMQMRLPALSEQKRRAHTLCHVESLLNTQRHLLTKLDELVKSRFVEMFGDCVINQKHWKTRFLEDIAEVGSSKRVFVEELQETGIPFYRGTEVGALAEGKPIDPELFITEEHYNKLCEATGKPQIGDLLMPSICPDGRIWVVNTDKPFYFKDGRVLWVHSVILGYNPVFLLYTLKDRIMSDYNSIASGTTFAELKIFALKKCRVFEVPLELQNRFAAFVAEVDKSKLAVKQSLEKLETLKKSLMQQYFG